MSKLIVSVFLITFFSSLSFAAEMVIMKIFLNLEEKGEYFLLISEEGDLLLQEEDLNKMGIKTLPPHLKKSIDSKAYVSLSALSPDVRFTINHLEASVQITANPRLLDKTVINLGVVAPEHIEQIRANSIFLNYAIRYNTGEGSQSTSFSLPLELGLSVNGWQGFSSFSYEKSEADQNFSRLTTHFTRDYPAFLTRMIIGDFTVSPPLLGGGGAFGGMSISRNFSLKPFFLSAPSLDLSGLISSPSDVEIYVNNILVKREQLSPGKYQFLNVTGETGPLKTRVEIKDAFGRRHTIKRSVYIANGLLVRGLHEFNYSLGFKRENFGEKNFSYGNEPVFSAFHRLGFNASMTAGMRGELDKNTINVGPLATFSFFELGEISTAIALSQDSRINGYGGALTYLYPGRTLSPSFSFSSFSRGYATIDLPASQEKSRFVGSAAIGFSLKKLGALSAVLFFTNNYSRTDGRSASLLYSKRIFEKVSLSVNISRTISEETVDNISFNLTWVGEGMSGTLNHSSSEGKRSESIDLQTETPFGQGFGYRFLALRSEDSLGQEALSGNGSVEYHSTYGIYGADYSRIPGENAYSLSASGGLTYINNAIYLSRPIHDSFALIKVSDVKGVRVNFGHRTVGRTNRSGEILVPDLISYYPNALSIEAEDIPVNYELKSTTIDVAPINRSGGIVRFQATKLQAFEGNFVILQKGRKKPAEFWRLEMQVDGKKIDAIVGRGGEFYLENILAGEWPARLYFKNSSCNFSMIITKSAEVIVDLGEIVCEMD